MAFTYETRKKITDEWVRQTAARVPRLTEREKGLLPQEHYYIIPQETCRWMEQRLSEGGGRSLSGLYREELAGAVEACVRREDQEEFYYALDQMNQYQMTAGWYRRSVRSESYAPFAVASIHLLRAYAKLWFYGATLAEVLTGGVSDEIFDHARTGAFSYSCILAAQLDRDAGGMAQAIEDILLGEGNTAMISHEMILGIVKSRNAAMHELLGKFLLAARLQEGVRQAVCETMDAGRPEAFLALFRVIEENNLVRYSSVKRAVSTWIGIFDEKSVDRITDKLVRLMGQCLRDEAFRKEQLKTEDAVAISCALWAEGFYDAGRAIETELAMIRNGTRNQKMTASYFNRSLQFPQLKAQAAKEVILHNPDDEGLIACFLPGCLEGAGSKLSDLVRPENGGYFSMRDGAVRKPDCLDAGEMHLTKEEAKQLYLIFRELHARLPKKGVTLDPCIFPWYRVSMTQSDLAVRMCLLAWMLQEEELLDEAAELIPLIGQGETYGTIARAAAARVFLYRTASERRKAVLFALLHNPEEYTLRSAHRLVEDMELTAEDYRKIEQNLKYKKGRAGTLSLLRRQKPEELAVCIERLLSENSEECHMGALDLALTVKKEEPEQFARLLPVLKGLENPTGKEQVLLGELLEEKTEAQDILKTPGYGLYTPGKPWVLPEMTADEKAAEKLFAYGEAACIEALTRLNDLIEQNRERSYQTAWKEEQVLGTKLDRCRWTHNDPDARPLDEYPFRELWEEYYRETVKTPELLCELYFYQRCRGQRGYYDRNKKLYAAVFGHGLMKKPPFQNLVQGLRYGVQAGTVIDMLYRQYVTPEVKKSWCLPGIAKLLSVLDPTNDLFEIQEKRYNGQIDVYTKRATELPVFSDLIQWLGGVKDADWGSAFTLRFSLGEYYDRAKDREKSSQRYYYTYPPRDARGGYLSLADYVQCYVRGIWDKDLFYQAVFTFLNIGSILGPASVVAQKGAVLPRKAGIGELNAFFGAGVIRPADGRYHFDSVGDEIPAMKLAKTLYEELIPVVLSVELKRGEQDTPFSGFIRTIHVIYGIPYMIQVLTALGKDTLKRGYSYYSSQTDRKTVLSHLLKVCYPAPGETAADLKRALKGTDITKKRLVELSMYAQQWIPLVEEYLQLSGFQSGCYYFVAHTGERLDETDAAMIARYTPLTAGELRDGAFDIPWFFEAYGKLGEKNWKLLYDAAKYSATGAAHSRARKYADAALGKVKKEELFAEIRAKRNKDLLMSVGLLPIAGRMPGGGAAQGQSEQQRQAGESDLLERYQFIQQYKKESRQFGAQRRASEGRAVEIALRNLSVNAGYTDVTRLTLRMENKLVEDLDAYFDWAPVGELSAKIEIDETGKSALLLEKDGKKLKSIPAKYKKDERILAYQQVNKKLKEQYSRTRQMMEQAMEDRTTFSVWEYRELARNPVVRPIVEPLVVGLFPAGQESGEEAASDKSQAACPAKGSADQQQNGKPADERSAAARRKISLRPLCLGFLTDAGISDYAGNVTPVSPEDQIVIAHPFDLYTDGHWSDYQKLFFAKQLRQPFKQVFRELYVKLSEELEKDRSLMFSGNQIWPQKTAGALRGRRWVADYEEGLQKIYYKENIVARIYAMADWFSPSDVEAPTLDWVVFSDRKTFEPLTIGEVPDIIYSEVMRDVDLAVSVASAGGVDPETSHSTIELRSSIVEGNLELFGVKNVRLDGAHAVIDGKLGQYTVHLGSGVVHQMGNAMLFVVPVHSQQRGRIFLPFVDDDPKTAEILSKILLFAADTKIKDPNILAQIR